MNSPSIGSEQVPKIIIADDHPLFRAALSQAVQAVLQDSIILEADNTDQLFILLQREQDLELVFLDLHMPTNEGFTCLTQLHNQHPDVTVIMVSSEEAPALMRRAIDFGASAFIPKSALLDEIVCAIRAVLEGDQWLPESAFGVSFNSNSDDDKRLAKQLAQLTPQQFEVLSRIADGQLNKQIAYELNIKETTVKKHVSAILEKLDVNNRTMAGMAFQRLRS